MIVTVQTVAIQMPQSLYHRLERLSELTRRPLEDLVVQTLSVGVPPLPDDLPAEMRHDLMVLEGLDDDALWQVARGEISPERRKQHSLLLEKNSLGTISEPEQATLARLRQEADQLMLRKAYAYVLLKWRGHRLPTLAELETQA
jgi:hypothetical protein